MTPPDTIRDEMLARLAPGRVCGWVVVWCSDGCRVLEARFGPDDETRARLYAAAQHGMYRPMVVG